MQVSCKHLYFVCCIVVIACTFFSCSPNISTTVRNYPVDTPFVFNNKIVVKGNIPKDENKRLVTGLASYWDDSLYAPRSSQYGITFKYDPPVFFSYRLNNPPVYDSANRQRTNAFMTGYLRSQGYYYSRIRDSVLRSQYSDQQRITMIDTIFTGKQTMIDSERYALATPMLQYLADSSKNASLIKPGKSPFAKSLIGAELDRLVTLYRQKGFFLLTRSNLIAEADTLDQNLLNLSLDPFEQAQKISESIEKRKQNPSTVITIMQRENTDTVYRFLPDSAYFRQYRIGNLYYFPGADINLTADSVMQDTVNIQKKQCGEYSMYYRRYRMKLQALIRATQMRTGRLYNEEAFNRTISNFNQLPAWSQVDYRTVLRDDSVDFYFFLSPARPQNITFSVEGSRNTGDFLSTGTLIGTAFNITYSNRNVRKRAEQLTATLSNGVEFTLDNRYPFLQTFLSSLNVAYTIPNVGIKLPWATESKRRKGSIKIDVSPNYSERNNFFRIRSLVTGATLEWKRRTTTYQVRLPNLEFYSLDTLPLLQQAFKQNPFLRSSFNTGSIVSGQGSVIKTITEKKHPNVTNFYRLGGELAFGGAFSKNLYGFWKLESEYRRQMLLSKTTSFAIRGFAGVGYNFSNNSQFGTTLPFFKQFVGGGPNSMRAWSLRQIGLGSSIRGDTSDFKERYGDMQLEANAEYRFNIATVGSVNIGSAIFVDAGNIWNIRKIPSLPDAEFDISRFWHDIAIGAGTGLRLDFNYFLIRLDFGLKWKNPSRQANGGWLDFKHFTWTDKEYTGNSINNYAIQLGIGLPF